MNQDWTKRTSWNQQASTSIPQSSTTGYNIYNENIELTDRRKKPYDDNSNPNTELADHHKSRLEDGDSGPAIPTDTTLSKIDNGSISQPRKVVKSFKLTTRPLGFNITITETTISQQIPRYFSVGTEFKPNTPDVVFYAGENKDGHRLAVAHFRFSRHIRMGFGTDSLTSGDGVWEEMRNTDGIIGHGRYEFEYNVPPDADFVHDLGADAGRRRKKFVWERTRDKADGVEGKFEQWSGFRNYRLVEQESGKVLAVMLTPTFTGASYKGVINLHEALSNEMEVLVMMTAICICEKGERRIRRYCYGSFSASGGP